LRFVSNPLVFEQCVFYMRRMLSTCKANWEGVQLMERRGYGAEYIDRYKMMTRYYPVCASGFLKMVDRSHMKA
jgi:hypothetical protein